MCGINAIFGSVQDESLIQKMNDALWHRGPDAEGSYFNPVCGLGSRRLRIIDLDAGDMPYHSLDGRYHMVFNGEIYNYGELQKECPGYSFASKSDGEVFFALCQIDLSAALEKVNGMFTFAIFDEYEKVMYIGRDRLGIKPLFYAEYQNNVFVSSEISALLEVEGLERGLDQQAAYHYLSLLSVPEPYSLYPRIRRFPAASYAKIDQSGIAINTYWKLKFTKIHKTKSEWKMVVKEKFRDSVDRRLVSDVPLGVMLSGGVDSTIIANTMSEIGHQPLLSFSMGFQEGDNETQLAGKSARLFDCHHRNYMLDSDTLLLEIPNIIKAFREPFAGGVPLWFLSRDASKHVTVALTGTGGDEMFGNYGRIIHIQRKLGILSAIKSWLKLYPLGQGSFEKFCYHWRHGGPAGHLFHDKVYPMREWQKLELWKGTGENRTDLFLDSIFWNTDHLSLEDRVFEMEMMTQLKNEFLYSQDILSMASHLELRVPFLDHTFVECLAEMPVSLRSNSSDPKRWMREIFHEALPDHILNQPKRGFMIPYGTWLRGKLKPIGESLLDSKFLNEQGLFHPEVVKKYWNAHQFGKDHSYILWSLLMFQIWFKQKENEDLDWLS